MKIMTVNATIDALYPCNGTISDCFHNKPAALQMQPGVSEVPLGIPEWEAILTGIALTIIIILTIVGNILVALSVITTRHLRIVQNYYIVSLAVADTAVALFVLPFSVVNIIRQRWIFGKHICKIWLTMDVMCCTSSILNLCIIALDRYWSISGPLRCAQKRTKNHVIVFIAIIWLLSFLISSPPLMGWNNWPEDFDETTPCELNDDIGYVFYSAMGSFYIPLLVMAIVYIKIYAVMRSRLRNRAFIATVYPLSMSESMGELPEPHAITNAPNGSGFAAKYTTLKRFLSSNDAPAAKSSSASSSRNGTPHSRGMLVKQRSANDVPAAESIDNTPATMPMNLDDNNGGVGLSAENRPFTNVNQFRQQKQRLTRQRERRSARTLSVIMGAFVICWLPFFLMYITGPFCGSFCPSEKVKNFLTWLGYINSGLNPIIYTVFNVDYRKAFKRLLGLSDT